MGDRYTISVLASQLKARFNIEVPESYQPRYNAAPTQLLPVITQGSTGVSFFYWGQTPTWSKNKSLSQKLLFANKEELSQKHSLKKALNTRRCLVPVDGYYDWKRISNKWKVAHRVIFNTNAIVALAGLWEEYEDEQGETAHTFKFITKPSDEVTKSLNNRAPMVLAPELEKRWLDETIPADTILEALDENHSYEVSMYSVSPEIENIEHDSEKLIAPFAPADQFGNYSLFD